MGFILQGPQKENILSYLERCGASGFDAVTAGVLGRACTRVEKHLPAPARAVCSLMRPGMDFKGELEQMPW